MDTGLGLDATSTPVEAPVSSSGRRRERKPYAQRFPTVRKRRWESEPFLLVIVDHDNRRYTIEGPMTDSDGWTREIIAARRSGRQISCRVVSGSVEDAVKICKKSRAGIRWPSGSIVAPSGTFPAGPTSAAGDEGHHAIDVTPLSVFQVLRVLYRSNRFEIEAVGENEFRLKAVPPSTLLARRDAAP